MTESKVIPDWIAVDWGTTHLRVWAMKDGQPIARNGSDRGMNSLARSEFEEALLSLVRDWLPPEGVGEPMLAIACGMVGARQGWAEAQYLTVPTEPFGGEFARAECRDHRLRAMIIPGLRQTSPADVMRGEETQIAGFLSLNKNWDGVICLPGTHTKWVHVSAGEVVSFQTFMTGELFNLLSAQSVLRHSVDSEDWDADAFATALDDAIAKPELIGARLFNLRASDLLQSTPKASARARLSGLLIGTEISAARPYWLGQNVALVGSNQLSTLYATALEKMGAYATITDAERMTLAGLSAAWQQVKEKA